MGRGEGARTEEGRKRGRDVERGRWRGGTREGGRERGRERVCVGVNAGVCKKKRGRKGGGVRLQSIRVKL